MIRIRREDFDWAFKEPFEAAEEPGTRQFGPEIRCHAFLPVQNIYIESSQHYIFTILCSDEGAMARLCKPTFIVANEVDDIVKGVDIAWQEGQQRGVGPCHKVDDGLRGH